jgi:serine/threonine protein phosphatase PrpC
LAITRAFGDYALKRDGVSAKPTITKHTLKPSDKFLVIASDGIWDVLEDEDVCKLCREELSSKEIGQLIV